MTGPPDPAATHWLVDVEVLRPGHTDGNWLRRMLPTARLVTEDVYAADPSKIRSVVQFVIQAKSRIRAQQLARERLRPIDTSAAWRLLTPPPVGARWTGGDARPTEGVK